MANFNLEVLRASDPAKYKVLQLLLKYRDEVKSAALVLPVSYSERAATVSELTEVSRKLNKALMEQARFIEELFLILFDGPVPNELT